MSLRGDIVIQVKLKKAQVPSLDEAAMESLFEGADDWDWAEMEAEALGATHEVWIGLSFREYVDY